MTHRSVLLAALFLTLLTSCMPLGMLGTHGRGENVPGGGDRHTSSVWLGSYRATGTFALLQLGMPSSHGIALTSSEPSGLTSEVSAEFVVEYNADLAASETSDGEDPFVVVHREKVVLDRDGKATVTFTTSGAGRYVLRFFVTVVHADGTSLNGAVESEYRISPRGDEHTGHAGGMWGSGGLWLAVPIIMMGTMLLYAVFAGEMF